MSGYPDDKLLPKNNITRAECSSLLSNAMFKLTQKENTNTALGIYNDIPSCDFFPDLITEIRGKTSGKLGGVHSIFVPEGKTGLYKIVVSSKDKLNIDVFDKDYYKVNEKYGHQDCYPLRENSWVTLSVTEKYPKSSGGMDYTIKIESENNKNPLEKTAYIMLNTTVIDNRYLGKASENLKYNYTEEFFRNYLNLIEEAKNKRIGPEVKVAFVAMVRDLSLNYYANGESFHGYNYLPLSEINYDRVNMLAGELYESLWDMLEHLFDAVDGDYSKLPQIYFPAIEFAIDSISEEEAHSAGYSSSEAAKEAIAEMYAAVLERAYEKTINSIAEKINTGDMSEKQAKAKAESYITGIYCGAEDAGKIKDDSGKLSVKYRCVRNVSKFAHSRGKKTLWCPYGPVESYGELVNTGIYSDNGKSYDLIDIVIGQPGVFFSDYKVNEEIKLLPSAVYDLKHSTENNAIMHQCTEDKPGPIVCGGKFTDTIVGFQIEFDLSAVTGRIHLNNKVIAYPQKKVDNFMIYLQQYKHLLFGKNFSFGLYPGGPNELAFESVLTGDYTNDNRHSIINHVTALDLVEDTYELGKGGTGKAYSDFPEAIRKTGNGYYSDDFDGRLMYNFIYSLLSGDWNKMKDFLGFTNNGMPINEDGSIYKEKN